MGLLSLYSSAGLARGSQIRLGQWACRKGVEREERNEKRRKGSSREGR